MNSLSPLYKTLRSCRTGLLVAFSLLVMSGCKEDETTASTGKEEFLQNTEYGLYVGITRSMVYQKYEHQISKNSDGTTFRLQTDNLSQLVACTFSADPAHHTIVEVTLRTIGIPKAKNGTSTFSVEKTEAGKCWLWDKLNKTGIIIPTE